MFTEELEKLNLKIHESHLERLSAEREKDQLASELRTERSRNAELAAEVLALVEDKIVLERKVQESSARFGEFSVLEQQAAQVQSDLAVANAELEARTASLAEAETERDGLAGQVKTLGIAIVERDKELAVTKKLVTAVREREALSMEIASATAKLGRERVGG